MTTLLLTNNHWPMTHYHYISEKICRGRKSGKPTKRYMSLRRFQKTLGLAPSMEASGDKNAVKTNDGSRLCRKAMWQWVFSCLEPKHRRLRNEINETLCNYLDAEKASGKPVRLVRSRVAVKAVKLLFRELVKQLAISHLEWNPHLLSWQSSR